MLTEIKNGVNVHTKIEKKHKRAIEALSRKQPTHENVIFNSAVARGLEVLKREMKAKR